jgi:hypothetical protein
MRRRASPCTGYVSYVTPAAPDAPVEHQQVDIVRAEAGQRLVQLALQILGRLRERRLL